MNKLRIIISIGMLSILMMVGCEDEMWDAHYETSTPVAASSIMEYLKTKQSI